MDKKSKTVCDVLITVILVSSFENSASIEKAPDLPVTYYEQLQEPSVAILASGSGLSRSWTIDGSILK